MNTLDWIIIGGYVAATFAIGLYFSKRAGRSTDEYFVAGRSLGWFLAGTSIVATTFSSDTPLVVAGISRQTGIYGHWFWLSAAIGQTATVFFFARYWRRTEAKTDIEFVSQRYEPSRATSALRIFKVFYDGVLLNCIVMASVILAMAKIMKALLPVSDTVCTVPGGIEIEWTYVIVAILGLIAALYSCLSGLYGVVYTDMLQFVFAMTGSIGLAAIVYVNAGKDDGMLAKLSSAPAFKDEMLSFFPSLSGHYMSVFTVIVYLTIIWWYRVPGNGYYVQRLLATRSEKDSVLAFLWFTVCQYVLRPWPWIMVGLLSLYYLPQLEDAEASFPQMIQLFMPAGLRGIMVVAMLAAFMSTIDTHVNWGASYIINDFYRPFVSKGGDERHYIFLSRSFTFLLIIVAIIIATKLTSILGAYKYLSVVYGGTGTVMIARWYWWRVNPWSEISAIISSLIIANGLYVLLADKDLFAIQLVVTVLLVSCVWVVVTMLTSSSKPSVHIIHFFRKMRLPGRGWEKVRLQTDCCQPRNELQKAFAGWITCVVFIYSATIALGKGLLHEFFSCSLCGATAGLSAIVLYRLLSSSDILIGGELHECHFEKKVLGSPVAVVKGAQDEALLCQGCESYAGGADR